VIERHFGESAPLSLGVEEELMILDAETLEPAAGVHALVRGAESLELPGTFKTELHASVVELTTEICSDVDEAVAALRELRAAAGAIARDNGYVLAAAGAHPTAPLSSLPVVQEERYLEMVRRLGYVAQRQGVNGLHVHVGVESADRCWERLEAVLPWLPVVLALSVNSPFVEGEQTGMLSNRASILAELPRGGAPPGFAGYGDWEAWDARPHPRLGTLEIRVADQPTSVERTGLIVGLVRDLVATAQPSDAPRADYLQNRWSAARSGLDATLLHPDGERTASARELARELLGAEPPEPEAHAQLGAQHVAADLVARTVG
jgi:glutamate---cysteine ligase / carboxylate-amine ligase